jgi:hypothetical protein
VVKHAAETVVAAIDDEVAQPGCDLSSIPRPYGTWWRFCSQMRNSRATSEQQRSGPRHLQHAERARLFYDHGQSAEQEPNCTQGQRHPRLRGGRDFAHAPGPLAIAGLSWRRRGHGAVAQARRSDGPRHLRGWLGHGHHLDAGERGAGEDRLLWQGGIGPGCRSGGLCYGARQRDRQNDE